MNNLGYLPSGGFYTLQDSDRQHHEDPNKDKKRQTFEIDKARIIHSGAFRRLQAKTQVLGIGDRDFYRTRLTHSLEVAQLGRGICREAKNLHGIQVDTELVEAVCLAHDIGHPPFGHSGEFCLHREMLKHGGFGANPQNLRIATFLEQKHADGGLNLSRAALDGLIKYPALFTKSAFPKSSKFTYTSSKKLLEWVKQGRTVQSIECQIADWADGAAYSVDDIEDCLRAGILDVNELEKRATEISDRVKAELKKDGLADNGKQISPIFIKKEAQKLKAIVMAPTFAQRKRMSKSWTSGTITKLLNTCEIVERDPKETCNRYRYGLQVPDVTRCLSHTLKMISKVLVFENPRVLTLESKGGFILVRLFARFLEDPKLLPLDFQEYIKDEVDTRERLIADFIAGMTDKYAFAYYQRLFEPGTGSFYEYV